MPAKNPVGVVIENGPCSWQIFQQDEQGCAAFTLAGKWILDAPPKSATVLVRVLHEGTYEAAASHLACMRAQTNADGSWSLNVERVPRGGLYRIETSLQCDNTPIEWTRRGDMIHHLGVGDVWVIAGQSNSAGYGKAPVDDGPQLGIHMFHASGEWRLATHPLGDSTDTQYPANREGANASHSPYLAFAKQIQKRLGYPIGLVPAALGGSPMVAWDRKEGGHLFTNLLDYVRGATTSSTSDAPKVSGMLWYQGESDTGPEQRAVYLDRFARMVADFRDTMNGPALPVITCQLSRYVAIAPENTAAHDGWDVMREIQRKATRTIPGVYVISTLDLGLSDGIHIDSAGNLVIGQRMASVALAAHYGLDVKHRHPDLASITKVDARTLDLRFNHVDERLNYENANADLHPFAVRDAQGRAKIIKLTLPDARTIRLEVDRDLSGAITVVGGPGTAPPSVVPFDIIGYRPMLAFTATAE